MADLKSETNTLLDSLHIFPRSEGKLGECQCDGLGESVTEVTVTSNPLAWRRQVWP